MIVKATPGRRLELDAALRVGLHSLGIESIEVGSPIAGAPAGDSFGWRDLAELLRTHLARTSGEAEGDEVLERRHVRIQVQVLR